MDPLNLLLTQLIGMFFLVGGSALLLVAIYTIVLGRGSKTWPATKGTIVSSYVRRKSSGGDTEAGDSFVAYIRYKYEVNGRVYKSESIDTAPGWWSNAGGLIPLHYFAGKKVAKYLQDKIVDVHYNPQSPEKAFLEPGVPIFSYGSSFFRCDLFNHLVVVVVAVIFMKTIRN